MTSPPTPIDDTLLSLLRCPRTGEPLRVATADEVAAANQQISAGTLRDAAGECITEPLGGGLITASGAWMYAIRDEIPTMIPEEAIATDQLQSP